METDNVDHFAPFNALTLMSPSEKKTLRKTTAARSEQIAKQEKDREAKAKMMKEIAIQKRVSEVRRLTQEELLEEAKITEELNLMSLGKVLDHVGEYIQKI